jgi:hypothetical protein
VRLFVLAAFVCMIILLNDLIIRSYDHILSGATIFFSVEVSDSHVVFVWFLIHRRLLVLPAFVCRIILLIIRSYDHMLADATRLFSYSLIVVWYLFAF